MLRARRTYVSARDPRSRRAQLGGRFASCAIPPYHRRTSAPALPQLHRAEPAQAKLLVEALAQLGGLQGDGRQLLAARVGQRAAHDLRGEALASRPRNGGDERNAAVLAVVQGEGDGGGGAVEVGLVAAQGALLERGQRALEAAVDVAVGKVVDASDGPQAGVGARVGGREVELELVEHGAHPRRGGGD